MRDTIKRILKEETDKFDKLYNMIMSHMLKNYSKNRDNMKPRDLSIFVQWANGYVKTDLEEIFGITEETHPELYDRIMNDYLSKTTGLLKKGTRVKLIHMNDEYSKLVPGDKGTIVGYNFTPWGADYLMKWDTGSTLNLVPKEDKFEVLS
jgi:hypothetical protein